MFLHIVVTEKFKDLYSQSVYSAKCTKCHMTICPVERFLEIMSFSLRFATFHSISNMYEFIIT